MAREIAELTIDSIAAGGDGVARHDGMVVFIPRSAPGDRIRATLDRKKGFARGRIMQILEASPSRVEPPCDHYRIDKCGGCQIQHIPYDAQLAAKSGIVRDGLVRIGKRAVDPPTVRASSRQWRYRTKLTLAMRRSANGWVAGLHPYDDPVGVFDLRDCPITSEAVLAVWREIMVASVDLPPVQSLRVSVHIRDNGAAPAAVVVQGGEGWSRRQLFFDRVPSIGALWWEPENRDRALVAQRSDPAAGASFAQINPDVAADLRAHVIERARSYSPMTIIDAYAGLGDTAAALAASGARVTAIELDADAAQRCGELLAEPSRAVIGRVEDHLGSSLPADVVIVNPPRTGMDGRASAALETTDTPPRAIIYVSCNPATLGRDLARMPRYRVESLVSFDMFPQTAHVETVCELVPESAA